MARGLLGCVVVLLWVSAAQGYLMSYSEYHGGAGSGTIYMAHWPDGFQGGAAGVIDDGIITMGGRAGGFTLLSEYGHGGAVRVKPVLQGWLDADLVLSNVAGDYLVDVTFDYSLGDEAFRQVETVRLETGRHRYAFTLDLPSREWMVGEEVVFAGENVLGLLSPYWPLDLIAADASMRVDSLLHFTTDMRLDFVLPREPAPVPEPSTLLLLGAGLTGLALWRRTGGSARGSSMH